MSKSEAGAPTENKQSEAPEEAKAMNGFNLKVYLEAQVREIEKYKWIESERRGYDIGFGQAAMEWIDLYSASFRANWFAAENEQAA
jgi:hypothetical protein